MGRVVLAWLAAVLLSRGDAALGQEPARPAPDSIAGSATGDGSTGGSTSGEGSSAPGSTSGEGSTAGSTTGEGSATGSSAPGAAAQHAERLLDRVYFATSSEALSDESQRTLDAIVDLLGASPQLRLRVEGHADARGSRRGNIALARRRAEAVRAYLVAAGVDARRIETRSLGAEQPLVAGDGPDALAKNRRVDLVAHAAQPA